MDALIARRICQACMGQLKNTRTTKNQLKLAWSSYRYRASITQQSFRGMCSKVDKGKGKYTDQWQQSPLRINDDPFISKTKKTDAPMTAEQLFKAKRKADEDNRKKSEGFSMRGLLIGTGGLVALYLTMTYWKREKELGEAKKRSVALGKAALGGDWELVNQDGKLMSNRDFIGQWVLLYFGFTHCPDICPDELEKLVSAVNVIDGNANIANIQPVFITVDPDRDTQKVIKEYLKEFSPKLIGFTGTKDQIDKATRAYRVYYSMGPKDEDNDYIVDHTIIMYLVNPDGEFLDYFGKDKTMLEVARGVEKRMKEYAEMKKKSFFS